MSSKHHVEYELGSCVTVAWNAFQTVTGIFGDHSSGQIVSSQSMFFGSGTVYYVRGRWKNQWCKETQIRLPPTLQLEGD